MLEVFDITKLGTGPARMIYAPTSVAIPAKAQDFVELINKEGVYKLAEKYKDFGSAPEGDSASYSRGFETESLGIEQSSGAIFTDITDVNRSFSLNIAEIDPENIRIIEGTTNANEAIAAGKNTSKQVAVSIGSVTEFDQFRVVLIGLRKKQSGIVKEPDGTERGRLIAVCLYRCQITADDSEIEVSKGNLLNAPIQFEAFPEPGQPPKKAFGRWFFEEAGEIKAE